MSAYYNENEPYAAQWLRNLVEARVIAPGDVDERSIKDVQPDDLTGYRQCHFFAGIAGWSLALRLAGWPDDRAVWTGSCPCQPFSVAGKQLGIDDPRHLWPELYRLIAERRPPVIFGEQVAAASQWLAGVRSDLETVDYAVGAVPVQAASAGALQYRDRIWFVACHDVQRESNERLQRSGELGRAGSAEDVDASQLAGRDNTERRAEEPSRNEFERQTSRRHESDSDASECSDGDRVVQLAYQYLAGLEGCQSESCNDESECAPTELRSVSLLECDPTGWGPGWTEAEFRERGFTAAVAVLPDGTQFIECPDQKWRRLPPPRVRWLGNGIPARVAKLRAFGNAIYPPAAAAFIKAAMECRP